MDEGAMAEELARIEPPLDEEEMRNQEIVRTTIRKYQNKVSDMYISSYPGSKSHRSRSARIKL